MIIGKLMSVYAQGVFKVKATRIVLWLLIVVALVWAGLTYMRQTKPSPTPAVETGISLIGGPFALIDQKGRVRTDKDFKNKYMLVYFGYSYCPDICPTGLQAITDAMEGLGGDAQSVQPIFISVDPERDTPEQLASYMENFNPRFIALTGSKAQVEDAMKQYRVFAQQADDPGSENTEYLIDHSSIVYLMAPGGEHVAHFTHATPASEMVEGIKKHLR